MLTTTDLSLGAKDGLCIACKYSVMLYGSKNWICKEDNVIRLEIYSVKIDRCAVLEQRIGFHLPKVEADYDWITW